jgi:hypothetical protein
MGLLIGGKRDASGIRKQVDIFPKLTAVKLDIKLPWSGLVIGAYQIVLESPKISFTDGTPFLGIDSTLHTKIAPFPYLRNERITMLGGSQSHQASVSNEESGRRRRWRGEIE